ncbi:MAG: CARDB domain-containing protein, partial [Anaerolineae bacterium]
MNYQEYRPELVVQHTGQVFPLTAGVVTLGTDEDNTIVLADPEVSVHHARLFWHAQSSAYYVEDLGSIEGTYVNEQLIAGPRILHDGDTIRVGSTQLLLNLEPVAPAVTEEHTPRSRRPLLAGLIVALLAGITLLCVVLFSLLFWGDGGGRPAVTIQSPNANARIAAGSEIILQATASGASDITRLELSVDGLLVSTTSSPNPEGTSLLTISKVWTFETGGQHEIAAEAFTAGGKVSRPTSIEVNVAATAGETVVAGATQTPTETPEATGTATPEPPTITPSPTVPPPPQIEYFQASPATIIAGQCTTLQWGQVSFASEATIEPAIGGVGTPGTLEVCPTETTTYVLTATGPGGQNSASATVSVNTPLADLTVDGIQFEPNPPQQGQDTNVRITLRNAGQGAAGPFNWAWQAGPEGRFDGRLPGLNPGESTLVTVRWNPGSPYDSLSTEALVDTSNEVTESDEANNQLAANVQVVAAPTVPETLVILSEPGLDGYWLNTGNGSNAADIVVGNGEISGDTGEVISRGFLSFDLSGIPAGAVVEGVELRFFQSQIVGEPYASLGGLVLEQVRYGDLLGPKAYDIPALNSAALAPLPQPNAWYILTDPTITSWL